MNYKLYWELTNEGDARLLRAFGETPEPRFPAEIEGRAITEIGDFLIKRDRGAADIRKRAD